MMCAKTEENPTILEIDKLSVLYKSESRDVKALDNLSLNIKQGEFISIVGESGSGKSTLGLALMNLLPRTTELSGRIIYSKSNKTSLEINEASESTLRKLRASELAMIFQEPAASFNPVYTIGYQLNEVIRYKKGLRKSSEIKEFAFQCLEDAGLEDIARVYKAYPHQLSGGMLQRAMIAQALAAGPNVLIADEATSSLDVTIQSKIINLLKRLNEECGLTVVFITHDLAIAMKCSDRIAVLSEGVMQDCCDAQRFMMNATSDYTQSLISSFSRMGELC